MEEDKSWALPGTENRRQGEKLGVDRGGNGVEVLAVAWGQEGSGRRERALSRGLRRKERSALPPPPPPPHCPYAFLPISCFFRKT